ncbi:MAG: hypothetical protein H7145_10665 [Akkermansiaceae bacterium]|nr:hypothetical protein [Armatimonadota bacterium]
MMFTLFAQAFGFLFLLSLLYVMIAECRACRDEETQFAPKKLRFKGCDTVFERIVTSAAFHHYIKR